MTMILLPLILAQTTAPVPVQVVSDAGQLAKFGVVSLVASGIIGLLTLALTNRSRRIESEEKAKQARLDREQEWERQDKVDRMQFAAAEKVAAAAEDVKTQAAEAAQLLVQHNKIASDNAESTKTELHAIKGMVDGGMTALMRSVVVSHRSEQIMLTRMIEAGRSAGREPSAEDTAALAALEKMIAEEDENLSERVRLIALAQSDSADAAKKHR